MAQTVMDCAGKVCRDGAFGHPMMFVPSTHHQSNAAEIRDS